MKLFLYCVVLHLRIKVFKQCWMPLLIILPSPADVPAIKGTLDDAEETSAERHPV